MSATETASEDRAASASDASACSPVSIRALLGRIDETLSHVDRVLDGQPDPEKKAWAAERTNPGPAPEPAANTMSPNSAKRVHPLLLAAAKKNNEKPPPSPFRRGGEAELKKKLTPVANDPRRVLSRAMNLTFVLTRVKYIHQSHPRMTDTCLPSTNDDIAGGGGDPTSAPTLTLLAQCGEVNDLTRSNARDALAATSQLA